MTAGQPTSQEASVAMPGDRESSHVGVSGDRPHLLRSTIEPSTLADVVEAVSVASQDERHVYVERLGDKWRWSLTHDGGAYPLMRIAARFLRVDPNRIIVPFRMVAEGVYILCEDPNNVTEPDEWDVLDFEGPTPAEVVEERVRAAFEPSGRRDPRSDRRSRRRTR